LKYLPLLFLLCLVPLASGETFSSYVNVSVSNQTFNVSAEGVGVQTFFCGDVQQYQFASQISRQVIREESYDDLVSAIDNLRRSVNVSDVYFERYSSCYGDLKSANRTISELQLKKDYKLDYDSCVTRESVCVRERVQHFENYNTCNAALTVANERIRKINQNTVVAFFLGLIIAWLITYYSMRRPGRIVDESEVRRQ